ncbi:hypothetical protein NKH16_33575 [Mesorhizobium sp. M1307]
MAQAIQASRQFFIQPVQQEHANRCADSLAKQRCTHV